MRSNSFSQQSIINVLDFNGVKGDGQNDDTDGLQAALDTYSSIVYLPKPKSKYIISRTLIIYTGQTLMADRCAEIKLADFACAHMLTNSDHIGGNEHITVSGGIWNGNNTAQTCEYHENGGGWKIRYCPDRYIGVMMRFNNVSNLIISDLTLKDPESFGIQLGNLINFTVEGITFDYNMLKLNMDGVHLDGNCKHGVIKNLKGATNDDLLALNADDAWMVEMSRGPITDIEIDGIFADNGYTAVRLLSAGSEISRIRLSNIYGSYRYYAVSFTHHDVHPGEASIFSDIVIDGLFCQKSFEGDMAEPVDYSDPLFFPLMWIAPGTRVKTLHINNLLRNEIDHMTASNTILVDENASVEYMAISNATITNGTSCEINLLTNIGTIKALNVANVYGKAEGGKPRGSILSNQGIIEHKNLLNIITDNFAYDQ
jgi:hypothetical protein